jgi:hypothetical protein
MNDRLKLKNVLSLGLDKTMMVPVKVLAAL